jgi:outer membrane biosynthesis protein TonB
MKFPVKCVVLMVALLMTACSHKQQKAQLPPLAPSDVTIPPPSNAPPPPNETIPTQPTQEAATPPEPAQKPVVRKKKPKPADETDQASNPTPEVSAIGQLSSGDPVDVLRQTQDSIASTEQSLKNISRNLDDSEKKTADHIREYIKEAREALATGDVDGAHKLADKARVLLNELTGK